jgi:protein gp37
VGCSQTSPGCLRCYAMRQAFRCAAMGIPQYEGLTLIQGGHPKWTGAVRLVEHKLYEPLHWRKPRLIFVNSMSDLFHEALSDENIFRVVTVMHQANWHTYQVLTKRSERMRDLLNSKLRFAAQDKHIWWGVSVENRKHGLPRIDHLRAAEVAVRFLSIEPLLEDIGEFDLKNINWGIVGGESGPGARPFDLDWARSIVCQCATQKVACFVKQLGHYAVENGMRIKLTSSKGGDWDEWPEDLRVRQYPTVASGGGAR